MHPNVAFRRKSKIAAERRMKRFWSLTNSLFAGEGQVAQLFERLDAFKIHAGENLSR